MAVLRSGLSLNKRSPKQNNPLRIAGAGFAVDYGTRIFKALISAGIFKDGDCDQQALRIAAHRDSGRHCQ